MKKLFASIAALMMATAVFNQAYAQAVMNDDSNPMRFGIQLGFNVPSFGESQYSATVGWNAGATMLYDLQDFIPNSYARASLTYTRKGASGSEVTLYNEKELPTIEFINPSYYLHYLEIPLHFGWAYEMENLGFDMNILAETGPYFSFRMSGSQRNDQTFYYKTGEDGKVIKDNGMDPSGKIRTGNADMKDYYDDLRRFDVGWGIHAGVMIEKKYQLMLGYDWGLCDAVPGITGTNRNFSVNLTVYFD